MRNNVLITGVDHRGNGGGQVPFPEFGVGEVGTLMQIVSLRFVA